MVLQADVTSWCQASCIAMVVSCWASVSLVSEQCGTPTWATFHSGQCWTPRWTTHSHVLSANGRVQAERACICLTNSPALMCLALQHVQAQCRLEHMKGRAPTLQLPECRNGPDAAVDRNKAILVRRRERDLHCKSVQGWASSTQSLMWSWQTQLPLLRVMWLVIT